MPVSVNTERKLVQIAFDPQEGDIQVYAYGQADDVHNTAFVDGANGLAVLSYPHDFQGKSSIEVRDADGNVVDSGDISI